MLSSKGLKGKVIERKLKIEQFVIFFHVYSFLKDRERQSTSRGGAEREGDTESKQVPDPELSAQSPMRGSNS